jgi:hypothetical protein
MCISEGLHETRVLCWAVGSAWKGEEEMILEISKFPEKADAT